MIKIVCDRCRIEIKDGNIGYIAINWRNVPNGDLLGDNPYEEKHFCTSCMKKIEEFVINRQESVIKTADSVIDTGENVPKQAESVPICHEQPPEQE